jgi:hypothetical protein
MGNLVETYQEKAQRVECKREAVVYKRIAPNERVHECLAYVFPSELLSHCVVRVFIQAGQKAGALCIGQLRWCER